MLLIASSQKINLLISLTLQTMLLFHSILKCRLTTVAATFIRTPSPITHLKQHQQLLRHQKVQIAVRSLYSKTRMMADNNGRDDNDKIFSSSWSAKNEQFKRYDTHKPPSNNMGKSSSSGGKMYREKEQRQRKKRREQHSKHAPEAQNQNFRDNFRGTRVFVQGLPDEVDWKMLKDHFKVAGEVVFASVSIDSNTRKSKGCGVVQYETTGMASNAIKIMRDHPINGSDLFVREDFQESKGERVNQWGGGNDKVGGGNTLSSVWRCADEDNASDLPLDEYLKIENLITVRDKARRKKDYETSDNIREELKTAHRVHLDDTLKTWWYSVDNYVPESVSNIKGGGRWSLNPWRQIPTTPENDACVSADLVNKLLKKRDAARKKKDFNTADAFLEQAKTSPDGDLILLIHDADRTWRIWTPEPPPASNKEGEVMSGAEKCIALVLKHEPEKVDEIKTMLEKFPGREYAILKRLKENYFHSE